MSRELLHVIDQISYERGLDRETVLKARMSVWGGVLVPLLD